MCVRKICAAAITLIVAAAAASVFSEEQRPASSSTAPSASLVADALSVLSRARRDAVLRALAGYSWRMGPGGAPQTALWVAAEFDNGTATRGEQWDEGADVSLDVTGPDGSPVDVAHLSLTRDSRSFVVRLPAGGALGPGAYDIRLTATPSGASHGSTETLHVVVPKAVAGERPLVGQSTMFRLGPFTGAAWVPAGDLRFRRQERVKVETAVLGATVPAAVRLLDRTGNPLPLPVASSEREEGGARVVSGEIALAPLSAGDYLLETVVTAGSSTRRVLAAFRIIP
jgi:hypothetical protein